MKPRHRTYLTQLLRRKGSAQTYLPHAPRFSDLLAILEDRHCHVAYQSIHIAGSKGKGSTASYIATTLQQLGYKTLLFTSPHLCDVRERFNHNGLWVDDLHWQASLDWLARREATLQTELPFFDAMTALLFYLAARLNIDFLILETGLGGRLDATNICNPALSIITPIELEHTAILGDNLAAIAYEKAGIIKKSTAIFLAKQAPSALEVFTHVAQQQQAALFYFETLFESQNAQLSPDGFYAFSYKGQAIRAKFTTKLRLIAENALLALAALDYLLPQNAVLAGWLIAIQTAHLPGRYQQLAHQPIVLDVSHTPDSFSHTSITFATQFQESNRILIFGCASDKDFYGMASHFNSFHTVYLVSPALIAQSMASYQLDHNNWSYRNAMTPLLSDLKLARTDALLIAGSFYLVAEAMHFYHL